MTAAPATSPSRFLGPAEIRAVAHLLKHSGACIESEIHGGSMGRTLPSGTRVSIQCGEHLNFEAGQVIAFLGGERLIAHRLCGRGRRPHVREFLLTRGDATSLCDAPVHSATVLGIVTARLDAGSWQPPPAPPAATTFSRAMRALANLLLEVHPELARLWAVMTFRVRNTVVRRGLRST